MLRRSPRQSNDARWQLLKDIFEAQPLDLAKRDCPIGPQSNEAKYLFAVSTPITAGDAVVVAVFGFIAASRVHRR
jgi:hypothetical protein